MISRIISAFESFAFKFLDFDGRATRLEYWCVIPLVWLFIFLMLPGDASEVWGHLLRREVPPLNPFHYGSLGLFLFTFIPRLSLTVRRLHDAGRSGRWAKLPFTAVSLGLVLSVGLLTAIPMSDPSGLGPGLMVAGAVTASLSGSFWEALFNLAAIANALDWDAILDMLLGVAAQADPGGVLDQTGAIAAHDPVLAFQYLFHFTLIALGPFIALLLHLYFMLLPSERGGNTHGTSPVPPRTREAHGGEGNAYAGYAYLAKRTEEEERKLQAARKAQVRELYQRRVLGKPGS
ncbi:DUF805 domain-containing protein [Leisingera aquaemixtae]|uniref:DUF805 domain-containing protein n=1 Tax=Leisingera aquaemixtae TaxID=1396826 RepID=A0ABY5WKU4_9RHOB|nr:DUF805 domain-containing protein [Leisingera aquaemixtae]UWQ42137.1 DUF805 domain-containing protein [Leisingera aquaemixtae]